MAATLTPPGPSSPPLALVTGAARRIGRAIAERLGADGYTLALHASAHSLADARALAHDLAASGIAARAFAADLADPAAPAALVRDVTAALGVPDLLVNNASVFEPDEPGAPDPAFWERSFAVNLRAPVELAALVAARAREGACIVNIVDQRVWRLNPRYFTYTLTKAALWTATQTQAQAFAPKLRVNAVGPGPVLPNASEGIDGFAREAAAIPLERAVDPREVADAVSWLAGARSVTGQMICVDGGQHLAWKTPDVSS